MELKKAVELQVEYFGKNGQILVDENGYIRLNDLAQYFPNKDMSNWARSPSTVEFVAAVEKAFNSVESTELKAVVTKRGRYKNGTYAHKWVALSFAMWLSPEFHIAVIRSYEEGTQHKQDWNIKRILAANNFKLMCDAVQNAHDPVKGYHYSNEARMISAIVFDKEDHDRDSATEAQLDAVAWLEGRNGALIDLGMDYQERKAKLAEMYRDKYLPKHLELAVAS